MTVLRLQTAAFLASFLITLWTAIPALACDGTGRNGCSCIAYSSNYHEIGDEVIADYEMQVDPQDLRNSQGKALKTIRDVLQQDRANYHKFHKASDFDKGDSYFAMLAHRQMFQSLPLTSYCGTDPSDPTIMYDRVDTVARDAMRQGSIVHVMLYRLGSHLRLHIATID